MNITFILTGAGRAALLDKASQGADVDFTHIALGDGTASLDATSTALTNENERKAIYEYDDSIAGQLMMRALFDTDPASAYMVTEAAIIGDGVVFAVWSAANPPADALVYRMAGVPYRPTYSFGLAGLPAQNINVVVQPLDIVADQMIDGKIAAHVADADAHGQYLLTSGGTMTGQLVLDGNATAALDAVPRQQLDSGLAGKANSSHSHNNYLPKNSGTASDIYNNGWYRSHGNRGWYSQTYGGGIYMVDTTWVRTYNNKSFYSPGTIQAGGNVIAYSDERAKKDWGSVGEGLVARLADIRRYGTFAWNDGREDSSRQIGVGAQSLQSIMPEAVRMGADGKLAVAYGNAALVAAVELSREVMALKAEINALKEQINGT